MAGQVLPVGMRRGVHSALTVMAIAYASAIAMAIVSEVDDGCHIQQRFTTITPPAMVQDRRKNR